MEKVLKRRRFPNSSKQEVELLWCELFYMAFRPPKIHAIYTTVPGPSLGRLATYIKDSNMDLGQTNDRLGVLTSYFQLSEVSVLKPN